MALLLLAEDDQTLLDSVVLYLNHLGHEVHAVKSGSAALEKICASRYDLVILDWQMPGMSGPEVLRSLRQADTKTPALMLTGRRTQDVEAQLERAGSCQMLFKPFLLTDLGGAISAILSRVEEEK